jgi:hypothetical protein
MKPNLAGLKSEIEEYLEKRDFVIFRAFSRVTEAGPVVEWDHEAYSDFRMFLDVAIQAGVKIVVLTAIDFSTEHLDEAEEHVERAELPREEKRGLQSRLRELRAYEGFTCAVEISFDYQGRIYLYSLRTDWYEDALDLLSDIDSWLTEEEDEQDEGPIGGYFSRN